MPVMLAEVLDFLNPAAGDVIIDCTVGGGGHSEAILERIGEKGRLIGIDMDESALEIARERLSRFGKQAMLVQGRYEGIKDILSELGVKRIDGALYDLGISSMQVDSAGRGFSFKRSGPLDMRMDINSKLTAEEVVNSYSESDLTSIFRDFGEERWASRIAKFIINARKINAIKTTEELVETIKNAIPASARRRGGHPARKVFQALRIEVNQELKRLSESISDCSVLLNTGKRGVVISYHSLEDRIAKTTLRMLKSSETINILTKKPIRPSEDEIERNPRSRSALMRVFERREIIHA